MILYIVHYTITNGSKPSVRSSIISIIFLSVCTWQSLFTVLLCFPLPLNCPTDKVSVDSLFQIDSLTGNSFGTLMDPCLTKSVSLLFRFKDSPSTDHLRSFFGLREHGHPTTHCLSVSVRSRPDMTRHVTEDKISIIFSPLPKLTSPHYSRLTMHPLSDILLSLRQLVNLRTSHQDRSLQPPDLIPPYLPLLLYTRPNPITPY